MKEGQEIFDHLAFVYGEDEAERYTPKIIAMIEDFRRNNPQLTKKTGAFASEKDTILITYADMLQAEGKMPLAVMTNFLKDELKGLISTVHFLPFFPYSSDDGFSVIHYRKVNPAFGSWENVSEIGRDFRLMFDAVINHISVKSEWFKKFLAGDPEFDEYFIKVDPAADLSAVFRPRALPLLSEVAAQSGPAHVWTTFSPDQIDLNYANPDVLVEILDTLLFYVAEGAEFIRLDAIAFMWKEIGTSCIHLPETHRLIQLMKTVLNAASPDVALITETNVPHEENISYFGDGKNEAQMVYNFSLPPLTLHAFQTQNAAYLTKWASGLLYPSPFTSFFNFMASHDGVGLMPVRGILSETQINAMVEKVEAAGGCVSYKSNSDGSKSPYELNVNFLDGLGGSVGEGAALKAARFLASQSIMLALRGVPGIYFHSLFGSQNWIEGVRQTGMNRTINRQKLDVQQLKAALSDPQSLRYHVFHGYKALLKIRTTEKAFDPQTAQRVLNLHPAVFALSRGEGAAQLLCLTNVSAELVRVSVNTAAVFEQHPKRLRDLVSGAGYTVSGDLEIDLQPYQVLWLKA